MSPSAASVVADIGGPFDLIGGLPLHPLVVHVAVVVLPAAALALIVIVLLPRVHWMVRWGVVAALAVGALSGWVAAKSGEVLSERVGEPSVHAAAGEGVPLIAGVLLALGIAWAVVDQLRARERAAGVRRSRALLATRIAVSVVAAAWAVYTNYATIVAGHSGAVATWWPQVGG